jgi:anti-sigma regulatory factor (Ser/Thr protein kinase)
MSLGLLGLFGLMLAANPIPALAQLAPPALSGALAVPRLEPLVLLFPLWMAACILLSIDVLRRPAQADDPNLAWARERAQPWLLGAAGALLAVGLAVGGLIGYVVAVTAAGSVPVFPLAAVALYDLALLLLIALAVLLLGQAVVVHEVFSGRVLPRRGLARHWRSAILLAGGYAVVAAGSITADLHPIYTLLLATLLMTLFYALYSWRALREREQLMARLRPFVQGEGSATGLATGFATEPANGSANESANESATESEHASATGSGPASTTALSLLGALCREVLDTPHAQLTPLGSMATLAGPALHYPPGEGAPQRPPPGELRPGAIPLDPSAFFPYRWALGLWGEWGVNGALLIGEKREGGLYSQEEMEIAQATGERILQFLASEQMLQRLMALQRTRTVEQRVADLHTRRALHDEILPTLHLAILQLNGAAQDAAVREALQSLAAAHRDIAALLVQTQPAPARAPDPTDLLVSLRALVAGEFAHQFAVVRWHTPNGGGSAAEDPTNDSPDDPRADRLSDPPDHIRVDALTGEVIVGAAREVIRNAALHGRGGKAHFPLRLDISLCREEGKLTLTIEDNGVGLGAAQAAVPGGGSGSGLALHSTLLAMIGGYLTVELREGGGTTARITVRERNKRAT